MIDVRNPNELKPHPRQAEIYSDDKPDADLIDSIKRHGVIQPIIITETNIILSGHRRTTAAIKAKIKTVPVEVRRDLIEYERLAILIETNRQRVKTQRDKAREAIALKEVETARAEDRQKAVLKQNATVCEKFSHTEKIREKGQKPKKQRAVDVVGRHLGMSGRQVEKLIEVEEKIEVLEATGQIEEAKKLERTLNKKSINAAHNQVKPKPQPEKPREPMLPKTSIVNDDLPGITEEWVRGKQWELNTLIMRRLTGKTDKEARAIIGRLIHDCTQSAVMGAMAIAGNNLNFIKSEKLEPVAYVKAIANRIRVSGNGRETDKPDKNWELINRMIEENRRMTDATRA